MTERATLPLSLVVIAQDEEAVIGRCLRSVEGLVSEMIVVDSGSSDKTASRAMETGAHVIHQAWLGYGAQRQVGIKASSNDWVLCLDADEVVTPDLARSIRAAFASPPALDAVFSVDRDIDFLGVSLRSPLRRSNTRQFVRLFNRTTAGWDTEAAVHERVLHTSRPQLLEGRLEHWQDLDFSGELALMNKYSSMEAEVLASSGVRPRVWRLVGIPVARFLWVYVGRRHWRYGARGFLHAALRGMWAFSAEAKNWEHQKVGAKRHKTIDG